jgi:hypothetical protein
MEHVEGRAALHSVIANAGNTVKGHLCNRNLLILHKQSPQITTTSNSSNVLVQPKMIRVAEAEFE